MSVDNKNNSMEIMKKVRNCIKTNKKILEISEKRCLAFFIIINLLPSRPPKPSSISIDDPLTEFCHFKCNIKFGVL